MGNILCIDNELNTSNDNLNRQKSKSSKKKLTIMLLGDYGVGKTSIINNLIYRQYSLEYIPTQNFVIHHYNTENLKLKIIDITGDLTALQTQHLPKVDSVVYVYDLSRFETLERISLFQDGVKKLYHSSQSQTHYPLEYVIANKADMIDNKQTIQDLISYQESKVSSLFTYVTSSCLGFNLIKIFKNLSEDAVNHQYQVSTKILEDKDVDEKLSDRTISRGLIYTFADIEKFKSSIKN